MYALCCRSSRQYTIKRLVNVSKTIEERLYPKVKMEEKPRKLEVIGTDGDVDESCKTFVLHKEDHTLGNSLRYMVMKNPGVQFCGYSIPHPSEEKINFRIQTYGKPATDILRKGLKDLNTVSEHVLRTFESSINEHKRRNQSADVEMKDKT